MAIWDKIFAKETKEDLDKGLEKSNQSIFEKFSKAVVGKTTVDDELLDEIEEILISSDVSLDTTVKIIERLQARVSKDKYVSVSDLFQMVKDETIALLTENNTPDYYNLPLPYTGELPYVMLIVGVNGVGKTTTIGKLAAQYKNKGNKVLLGAADTFRAAAVDQLTIWSERAGVDIVNKGMNVDPASVAFETVEKAIREKYHVVFVDTAGRLHNKVNLMTELGKIKRVMQKADPAIPHDVMLVVDGSTGQNALEQAKQFSEVTEITCLAVTKLDGTAKGGVVIAIADQLKVPIKFIGVGEKIDQLQIFNKKEFVDSLFKKK